MPRQVDAPQDECPHDDLAQLGVGLDEREQVLALQFDNLPGFGGANLPDARPSGEGVHLACELTRSELRHELVGVTEANDFKLARCHDEHPRGGGTRLQKNLACRDWAHESAGLDACDLDRSQPREDVLVGRAGDQRLTIGHVLVRYHRGSGADSTRGWVPESVALGSPVGGGAWSVAAGGPKSSARMGLRPVAQAS